MIAHAEPNAVMPNCPTSPVRRFHEDERGLNIVEIVLIIFVAVLILIGLAEFFKVGVWEKLKKQIGTLIGYEF